MALEMLAEAITHPDEVKPLVSYGKIFTDGEKPGIPLPWGTSAGIPVWIQGE